MMSLIQQRKSHDDIKRFFPAVLCCCAMLCCAVLYCAIQLVGSLVFAGSGSSGGGFGLYVPIEKEEVGCDWSVRFQR